MFYFYVNANIYGDFQICISVPLTAYFTVLLAQNYENRIQRSLIKLFNKKVDVTQNEEENIKLLNNPFWKVK